MKSSGDFDPDSRCVDAVCPAANSGERAADKPVDILLLHYTGMSDDAGALDWLTCGESGVSCHYFVWPDGRSVQLVPEARRAWHAGESFWAGERDINSRSIGIEIANAGHEGGSPPFPDRQIEAVIELCRDCVGRHHIPAHRVLAHSDVAPQRKRDPGEFFPWHRLYAGGIGHWVEPTPIGGGRYLQGGDRGEPVAAFQAMLSIYGYDIDSNEIFDEKTTAAVGAFQRHFRPERVDGVADFSTIDTLYRLVLAKS